VREGNLETKRLTFDRIDSLTALVSPLIPGNFRHGFTTKIGGVSPPPFDGLNLGDKWGDSQENVAENRRRLRSVAGTDTLLAVSQVHGTRVLCVSSWTDSEEVRQEEADGLCSDAVGVGISVHVADCVPVLMADPKTGGCAALHAGWRGTVAGMGPAGVTAMMANFGSRARDLRVALGPCIGPCCFEVGPEVLEQVEAAWPGARAAGIVLQFGERRPHIDLRLLLQLQLAHAGVSPENIDTTRACTFCDPAKRFYSYRRAGRSTGQMVGFIVRAR
jgi:polyphenol oxidase